MQRIVLISGKQGSGKSTLQRALIKAARERQRTTAWAINFADVLYEMHDAVLRTLNRYWIDRGLEKDGNLLQVLGTEWGRKTIDENLWVKITQERVRTHYAHFIVIGDCRFPNEFDAFPDALRVRLVCDEAIRKQRCSMWRENTQHPSEIALDQYEKDGLFDLYLDTGVHSTDHCVELVLAQLKKDSWIEKRIGEKLVDIDGI